LFPDLQQVVDAALIALKQVPIRLATFDDLQFVGNPALEKLPVMR